MVYAVDVFFILTSVFSAKFHIFFMFWDLSAKNLCGEEKLESTMKLVKCCQEQSGHCVSGSTL